MLERHRGWHSRGYLPHCDAAGLVQHVVFATVGEGDEIARHFGAHFLKRPDVADLVQAALLHFDGERYALLAWCVMPNHVHVVIEQRLGRSLADVVHSWKSFTAKRINTALARQGALWLPDYFDRYLRSDAHLAATIAYVEANPVAAGLALQAAEWPWSSAARRAHN